MPTVHNRIGGSTIARTIECPAWHHLSKDSPKQSGSNEFADTGTLLHDCMEEFYLADGELSFADMLEKGREYNGIELTQEMIDEKLAPALAAAKELFDIFNIDDYLVEPFVELIEGDAGGSIDLLAWSVDKSLVLVLDWKFGFVPVVAENNRQLRFYGLCGSVDPATADIFIDADVVVFAVVQPNGTGYVCENDVCEISVLDSFEVEVYDAIDRVDCVNDDNVMDYVKAGEHCQYCPAHSTCPVKTGEAQAALRLNPTDAVLLNSNMSMVGELEKWCKAVKKMAHEQMELGVMLADWKLVSKRASRVWTDSEEVQKKIRNSKKLTVTETHEPMKLLSPAKLEKVLTSKGLDKDKFKAYYGSVSSGNTVAHCDDKRPEILQAPSPAALAALRDSL